MKNTAPEKSVRQFLLRVGRDNHNGAVLCFHRPFGLIDVKLHLVQLPQQVIRKFQVCLVNLVDQKHHLFLTVKSLAQFSQLNIAGDIIDPFLPELSVVKTLYGIIHIQAFLGLRGRLDVPDNQPLAKRLRHGLCQHGLAGARLPLDQKRLLKRNRNIHTGHELLAGHIFPGSLKSLHFHALCTPLSLLTLSLAVCCPETAQPSPFVTQKHRGQLPAA